jgi:hypothetical protein
MSAKLQAQPIPMSRPFPAAVLWAVLAILLAAAVAVGAYALVRPSDDTVAGTGSTGITSDRPATSVSDTSLVKAGLQPVPFSPMDAGAADIAGAGHSPQQR